MNRPGFACSLSVVLIAGATGIVLAQRERPKPAGPIVKRVPTMAPQPMRLFDQGVERAGFMVEGGVVKFYMNDAKGNNHVLVGVTSDGQTTAIFRDKNGRVVHQWQPQDKMGTASLPRIMKTPREGKADSPGVTDEDIKLIWRQIDEIIDTLNSIAKP